jgi:UPF0042 nucleotide-binding protein
MIVIRTFGYRWRKASDYADVVVDCRSLRNPYRDKKLRKFSGLDLEIKKEVKNSPGFGDFYFRELDRVQRTAEVTSPCLVEVGCFGGKHRSVVIGELLAGNLRCMGFEVEVFHLRGGESGISKSNARG